MRKIFGVFSLLCIFLVPFLKAQDDDDEEIVDEGIKPHSTSDGKDGPRETSDLLKDIPASSPDIQVSYKIVPNRENEKIYPGDTVDLLIGFYNTGTKEFQITEILTTLTDPHDKTAFVRNFSAIPHNISVEPNERHSLEYKFLLDARTNPLEYGIITLVFYNDAKGRPFASPAINSTITVHESPNSINAQGFFIILLVAAIVIVVAILGKEKLKKQFSKLISLAFNKDTKKKKKSVSGNAGGGKGTVSGSGSGKQENEVDEWLEGTSSAPRKRKTTVNAGGKRKVSSSPNPKSLKASSSPSKQKGSTSKLQSSSGSKQPASTSSITGGGVSQTPSQSPPYASPSTSSSSSSSSSPSTTDLSSSSDTSTATNSRKTVPSRGKTAEGN